MSWTRIFRKADGTWPDPPHFLTLMLTGLAPILSIAALIVAILGYRTANRSLEVGQRAYVSLSAVRFVTADAQNDWPGKNPLLSAVPIPEQRPNFDTSEYVKR